MPLPTSPSSKRCIGYGRSRSDGNFHEDALLRGGGLEGQDAFQSVADFVFANAHGNAAAPVFILTAQRERQLIIEKLFED